jgi:hypothetical protein
MFNSPLREVEQQLRPIVFTLQTSVNQILNLVDARKGLSTKGQVKR